MLQVTHAELSDALREIEHRCDCIVSTVFYRQDGALLCDIHQDGQHSQTIRILEVECALAG